MCGVIVVVLSRGKNNIIYQMIYVKHGRKLTEVNLYYTNAGSIQYSAKDPKIEVATEGLKKEKIDLIGIAQSGTGRSKTIKNKVKRQL